MKRPIPSVGLSEPRKVLASVGDVGDKLFWLGEEGERLRDCGIVDNISSLWWQNMFSGTFLNPRGLGTLIVRGTLLWPSLATLNIKELCLIWNIIYLQIVSKYIFLILISDITQILKNNKLFSMLIYVRIGMRPSGLKPPTGARSIFFKNLE